jgi:hypothetical protein
VLRGSWVRIAFFATAYNKLSIYLPGILKTYFASTNNELNSTLGADDDSLSVASKIPGRNASLIFTNASLQSDNR